MVVQSRNTRLTMQAPPGWEVLPMREQVLGFSMATNPALILTWVLVAVGFLGLITLGIRAVRTTATAGQTPHTPAFREACKSREFRTAFAARNFGPAPVRTWWTRHLLTSALVAVLVTALGGVLVEKVIRPFPDPLPITVYLWISVGLFALGLCVGVVIRSARARHPWLMVGTVLSTAAVLLGGAGQVNAFYAEFPTLGTLIGIDGYRSVSVQEALAPAHALVGENRPAGTPLEDLWTAPADMPQHGAIVEVSIPGATSGFAARPSQIYFPPAYFTDPRPALPVLVLLPGQPGDPSDWVMSGRLPFVADSFAANHEGLAPIVVVADPIGSPFANTLCVDSTHGNAFTYLTVDVPTWVRETLQVSTAPRSMAIGGLSFGGTCALQLALGAPTTYPIFLDFSGQNEPDVGTHQDTVDEFFGGNEQTFRLHNPADILANRTFPDLAGAFIYGSSDSTFGPATIEMYTDARNAGIDAHLTELPGGHSYTVWSAGLQRELPWVATQLELTK